MSEWVTLGALADAHVLSLGDGYRTKQAELADHGFRIIRVADVRNGRISLDSPDHVRDEYSRQVGSKRAQPGDVLLTTKGTVGRVAIVPPNIPPAVYSPQLCWFRVHETAVLSPLFLGFWLRSAQFLSQAAYMQGNTDMAPYISLSDLRQARIDLPPITEQQAIAEVLGALDDKIAANTALAATSWTLMEAQFRAIQADPDLERRTLGAIVSLEYGKALPTNLREPGDVSVVGSGGANGVHSTALVQHSGVVVGRKGSAGSVHWVSGPHFPIDTTFYVRGTEEAVSQPYLYFLLRTLRLDEMNNDSAVPGLNRSEALALPVSLPPATRLAGFTSHAERLIELVEAIDRENRTLAETRDTLLPQLMSGKLRVRDAERIAVDAGL